MCLKMKANQKKQSRKKEGKWVTHFRSLIKPDLKLGIPGLFGYVDK